MIAISIPADYLIDSREGNDKDTLDISDLFWDNPMYMCHHTFKIYLYKKSVS